MRWHKANLNRQGPLCLLAGNAINRRRRKYWQRLIKQAKINVEAREARIERQWADYHSDPLADIWAFRETLGMRAMSVKVVEPGIFILPEKII